MALKTRLQNLLHHRPVRYVLVGGWNTALGYSIFAGIYTVGYRLHLNHILASQIALVVGNVICVTQAYFLYKYKVFKTPHLSWMEFFRFSTVYAFQLAGNLVALPVLVHYYHIHPLLGQAILIPVFVLLTYVAHHYISFRHNKNDLSEKLKNTI